MAVTLDALADFRLIQRTPAARWLTRGSRPANSGWRWPAREVAGGPVQRSRVLPSSTA